MCEQNILGSEYVELIESCTAQRCGLHKSSPLKTLWSHVLSATLRLTFTFPTVREEIEKRICHQFSLLAFFQTLWPQQIVQPPSCLRGRVQTAAGGKEERLTFICSLLARFSIPWAWETYECSAPLGCISTHCPDGKTTETPVRLCKFHIAD